MSTLKVLGERPGLPILPVLATDATEIGPNPTRRLPSWLKRPIPAAGGMYFTKNLIGELGLETICESARCPNRSECWTRRTATFMILGEVCTRPCGFCAVKRGHPEAVALDEPDRLAEACARLGLKHVVITSAPRDALPDGGAGPPRRRAPPPRRALRPPGPEARRHHQRNPRRPARRRGRPLPPLRRGGACSHR